MTRAELPPSDLLPADPGPMDIPHVHPPIAEALALRQQLATTPLDVRWAQVPGCGGPAALPRGRCGAQSRAADLVALAISGCPCA